jgi:glycosyltransferase involved in cell wall biosynthesis
MEADQTFAVDQGNMATMRQDNLALRRRLDFLLQAVKLSRWILTFRVRKPLQFLREYFNIKRSLLFDPSFYLEQNPDLPREGMDLLAHYTAIGGQEGRDPNSLFDTTFYWKRYADAAEVGVNPLVHYIEIGVNAGFDPNPLFDTSYYLERNPDVVEAGLNPLAHYLCYGVLDGRNPNALFDTSYYMMHTPELADTKQNPLAHYLSRGVYQGKKPNPLFITNYYLKANADVAASGMNPLVHYFEYGFREGRKPNPFFDTVYYLEQNPDVAGAGLNPLVHYFETGAREGRNPHPFFDTVYYLKMNADVMEKGMNPLVHYLEFGLSEGRYPYSFYEEWIQGHRLMQPDLDNMVSYIRDMAYKPVFSVLVPVYNTNERWLRRCLDSVLTQLYPYWELCIADDNSTEPHIRDLLNEYLAKDSRIRVVFRRENGHISASSNSALELARGEFVALLDHDDEITIDALYENAVLLNSHPDADMIYSDEDKITEENLRHMPFFKPDWSPDTFLSQMYSGHLGVYRTELIRKIGGFRVGFEGSQDYDLVLRFTELTSHIYHIPKILYHWRTVQGSTARSADSKNYAYLAAKEAIQEALDRRGEGGWVEFIPHQPGQYRVHYPVQGRSMISIIIPTRDNGLYLCKCLASIFEKTTHNPFEVVIIDNGSSQAETLALFDRWKSAEGDRVRVIRMDIPFNYACLNNEGVRQARGDLVCLLNDDTEVITANWLEELAGQAQRECVGAASAFLLYPNSTIQHAGVILGVGGPANHSHRHWSASWVGYFGRLLITADYAAVTGACLMVGKKRYLDVGGLDEGLAVAYNDVDFCLRLLKSGYRNVVLSHVRLFHNESRSRGFDKTPDNQSRYAREAQILKERWGDLITNDPYYNPNLTRNGEDFSLVTDRKAVRSRLIRELFL